MIDQPSSPDSQTLIINLEEVLNVVNAEFEQQNVALPTRQYVTVGGAGDIAWDCEQLVVSIEQVYTGLPGQQEQVPGRCDMPHSGVIVVSLVRCIPTGAPSRQGMAPPTALQLDDYGKSRLVDSWLLMNAGHAFADAQSFIGGLADVSISPPQGGYQAVILTLVSGLA